MLSTFDCLIPIVSSAIIFLLVRHIVSDRYKSSIAKIIVSVVFVLSVLPASIYYKNGMDDFHKNERDYVNPALEWQKIDLLSETVSNLSYHPNVGIFAVTDSGEVQLTKSVPYCSVENQTVEILPEEIKLTDTPFAELPSPPQSFKQQLIFEIQYAVDYDTLALSSFTLLDNGEVWCTERVFRGPADFPTAVVIGMGYLITAIAIFLGSLTSLLILTIIVWEIYRWRRKNVSE